MKFQSATVLCTMLAMVAEASPYPKILPRQTECAAPNIPVQADAASNATAGAGAVPAKGNGTANAGGATANATALVLPDGRIAQDAVPEDFNVLASKFKSAVVKGDGLVFSDLIDFPAVDQSIFDKATNTKAFRMTITDESIFIPQGGEAQANIRRADLLPSIASTLDNVATTGVKTMHFSVQLDATKPLNTAHDYQLVSLESADFSFHQFDVRTGAENAGNIVVNGNSQNAAGVETLFTTPFTEGFQNFALKMDFDANTMEVFHSVGDAPLASVTAALPNDLAGNGEYHFAIQKNAIGTDAQEAGINEAVIYGGIFMQDGDVVTLQ